MSGEILVDHPVTDGCAIILTIGKVFQNGWHRILFRIGWQPDARRQAHAIG
jgi:hypothetical protein